MSIVDEAKKRAALLIAAVTGNVKNLTYSSSVMEAFGVQPSASGMAVTPTSAMRVAAVFACTRIISSGVASLPLHIYERTEDGRKRVDHPFWWLLNEKPTARYIAAAMWESEVASTLLRGDGFVFLGRDGLGNVKELIPLPTESVESVLDNSTRAGSLKYYVNDVKRFGVDPSDMLHFPGFGFDGVRGMSVIRYAANNAAGNALAMDEYSGNFFAGGAHPSTILETSKKMSPEQIENLQKQFVAKYSGTSNLRRLPLVLTDGLTQKAISINAEDSQLLDARKFQVIDIARAFGVPPHMIGETSASTSWGSGIEAMSRAFVTYTLNPHLVRIEQELNAKLWPTRSRYFVEFNREAALEGDSKSQAEYFTKALGGPGSGPGWMTVNEVRRTKNLPPQKGSADELFRPEAKSTTDPGKTESDPAAQQAA
jgi:HK97 family phage portal protein